MARGGGQGEWSLEYRTVLLAAFLHDIGKLLQRGDFKELDKRQHPGFSADFISSFPAMFSKVADAGLLKELVQKHHENKRGFADEFLVQNIDDEHRRTVAKLVSLADNLSSSERSDNSDHYQYFKTTPLNSVIQRLDNPKDENLNLKFHPVVLPSTGSRDKGRMVFPEALEYQPGEMNSLIKSFGVSFKKYADNLKEVDYDSFITHLNNLVYAHTWCIASNTQEAVPDISLYDHLKTTAAIAACLYNYHQKKDTLNEKTLNSACSPRFILAAGDISGIQRYIFDIPSSATKGVAKRLRARSLFIQLCSEIAAHQILHHLGLPSWNIIMNSGGNFYLLLPNLPETVEALSEIQKSIDQWLIANLNGELALNLAWHEFGDEGFKDNFGSVVYAVKQKLNLKKQNKFSSYFQKSGAWENTSFTLPVSFNGQSACPSCHKYPKEKGQDSCFLCSSESKIGSLLPKADYISFYKDSRSDLLNIFDYSVDLSAEPPERGKPYLVEKLNNPDLSELTAYPSSFKYLANYVAKENGEVLPFEQIAKKSDGQELLGFLKADVDNLGRLVIFGLKRDNNPLDTISRQTTFSRLMDTFFTGYLESLVSVQYPDCYTVYSGGDDLFYVGPWDQILDLAEQINRDFHEFTGNPGLTLSAGVSFTQPGYPVDRAAGLVEEALEQSKHIGSNSNGTEGRNRITLLGSALTWIEWDEVKKEWQLLQNILDKCENSGNKDASSFLYHLLKMAGMWQEYRKEEKTSGLRLFPLLAYNVKRNLDERKMPELYQWAQGLLCWPPGESEKRRLDHLELIVTLCLFSIRGGNKE